ncbi:MAG TPA: hypothetical protein VLB67_02410 [Acidimicrobiia bacterium]|nr:hypothetical protein [Acidimicrobiia bacterium]
MNMVRAAGTPPGGGGLATPPVAPPPRPEAPSPKLSCPECGFTFIVGEIEVATCPNCSAEVPTGWVAPAESPE